MRVECFALFLCSLLISVLSVQRGKNWDKLTQEADKQWEEGDSPEELEYEFERNKRIQASKMPRVNMSDGAAIVAAYKADPLMFGGGGGGMIMIFVDLLKEPVYSKEELDKLAGKWSALLRTASVPCTVYNLEKNSLMVSVEKGWLGKDVFKFLSKQPEVEKFTANSKSYYPKDYQDNEEDDD